jgi:hypothetical protein
MQKRIHGKVKSWLRTVDRRLTKGRLFLLWHGVWGRRYRKIMQMNENPILIGGCGRSGTSLLLSLLSVHSNIYAVPRETYAFRVNKDGRVDPNGAFQIDLLYSHFVEDRPPLEKYSRWCEKTPKNIQSAERVLDYFGEGARFLHIVRDGRDVVTSTHPSDPTTYWVPPARWVADARAGKVVEKHPHVLTVRYEDLTTDPLSEMRRICAFLGEPFEKERFRAYPASAQFGTGDFFSSSSLPGNASEKNASSEKGEGKNGTRKNESVHTRSIDRWEKKEHASVVRRLLDHPGAVELLKHYGYMEKRERRKEG